jgi:hypothetical protein
LLHLLVQLLNESCPILQADLENFPVIDLADADKVEVGMRKVIPVWQLLDNLEEFVSPSITNGSIQRPERTLRCALKKLQRKSARLSTNSWSLELLLAYIWRRSIDRGIVLETVVKVSVNIWTNLSS